MNLEDLKSQLSIYRNAVNTAKQYRADWKDGVREQIINTLTKIVEETKMNAEVKKEDKMDGMQLVYLAFKKRESGISEHFEDTTRPYMKEGGYLFYTQIYNGKISVFISLPTIENFIDRKPPKPLGVFDPSDITEAIIVDHVTKFLKEMAMWEDNDLEHQEIGFKMRN